MLNYKEITNSDIESFKKQMSPSKTTMKDKLLQLLILNEQAGIAAHRSFEWEHKVHFWKIQDDVTLQMCAVGKQVDQLKAKEVLI